MEEIKAIDILKNHVDFLIRPKTEKDTEKIMEFIMLKIDSYSHTAFNEESNKFYRGILGHRIRKQYRKNIAQTLRPYIRDKLKGGKS
jgi:REP element-mobilizing transposase RayT